MVAFLVVTIDQLVELDGYCKIKIDSSRKYMCMNE